MGEAAVLAYALETGLSFGEAEEALYPQRARDLSAKNRCPICKGAFASSKAAIQHLESGFHKDKARSGAAITQLKEPHHGN